MYARSIVDSKRPLSSYRNRERRVEFIVFVFYSTSPSHWSQNIISTPGKRIRKEKILKRTRMPTVLQSLTSATASFPTGTFHNQVPTGVAGMHTLATPSRKTCELSMAPAFKCGTAGWSSALVSNCATARRHAPSTPAHRNRAPQARTNLLMSFAHSTSSNASANMALWWASKVGDLPVQHWATVASFRSLGRTQSLLPRVLLLPAQPQGSAEIPQH